MYGEQRYAVMATAAQFVMLLLSRRPQNPSVLLRGISSQLPYSPYRPHRRSVYRPSRLHWQIQCLQMAQLMTCTLLHEHWGLTVLHTTIGHLSLWLVRQMLSIALLNSRREDLINGLQPTASLRVQRRKE